ncbi:MAG TPA: ATP--dephospho-CoA triphosphoribosyl transferase CitG [Candidatus Bathyarchaeota archaeon]|nr:ATP--dephospho-CoA triphosphoribosyl transferase CitG [Candidatus Bathyarchaeota archaeon]
MLSNLIGRSMKPTLSLKDLVEHVRFSAQLAAALEVSAWPKPGNVHRTVDHPDARYEQFLAGSIALGRPVGDAALKGYRAGKGELEVSKIGVGKLVKQAVQAVSDSHMGGNTHLGICLLFIPLAASASKTYAEKCSLSIADLRSNIDEIMNLTTPLDTVEVYEAIVLAGSMRGLGRLKGGETPDLYDKHAKRKILKGGVSLFDAMKESSSYDAVARELVTGMEVSFNIGLKELTETFKRTGNINIAVVHTFLKILSLIPDTLIARKIGLKVVDDVRDAVKIGLKETRWISEMAKRCLSLGGLTTHEGEQLIWEFDRRLQSLGRDYNPGTTADLTASSLMIALLLGLKF